MSTFQAFQGSRTEVWLSLLLIFLLLLAAGALAISKSLQCAEAQKSAQRRCPRWSRVVLPKWKSPRMVCASLIVDIFMVIKCNSYIYSISIAGVIKLYTNPFHHGCLSRWPPLDAMLGPSRSASWTLQSKRPWRQCRTCRTWQKNRATCWSTARTVNKSHICSPVKFRNMFKAENASFMMVDFPEKQVDSTQPVSFKEWHSLKVLSDLWVARTWVATPSPIQTCETPCGS